MSSIEGYRTSPPRSGSAESPARVLRISADRATGPVVGVSITVPEYLDRLDIVERTSANELKPVYQAQWGESLAETAASAVTDNLAALLPSADFVTQPSHTRRALDLQVNVDLTRFESDATGMSTLNGRWSIADGDGKERASARVTYEAKAESTGYDAMAAAMSRNLAALSAEIAAALTRAPTERSHAVVATRSTVSPPHPRRPAIAHTAQE